MAELLRASTAVIVIGLYAVAVGAVWSLDSALTGRGGRTLASRWPSRSRPLALLFALLATGYRYLAAGGQPWAAALVGSGVATAVMAASTVGVSVYLALGFAASAYGAAASFFVFLLWLFFLGIGFVVGAEVTSAWQELRSGAGHVER